MGRPLKGESRGPKDLPGAALALSNPFLIVSAHRCIAICPVRCTGNKPLNFTAHLRKSPNR